MAPSSRAFEAMDGDDTEVTGRRSHRRDEEVVSAASLSTDQMIAEVLQQDNRNVVVRGLMRFFGIDALQQRIARERSRRLQPSFVHPFPRTQQLVKLPAFEVAVGLLMVVNGIFIGLQASASSSGSLVPVYDAFEHVFTGTFTLELLLRCMADGWTWVFNTDNAADVLLVVNTGVVPMWILKPAGVQSGTMRSFSILRVLRLIRLVRLVRTMKLFRIFWTLIRGLLDSGRTLLFMYLIIGASLYIFSIFGVYWIGRSETFAGDPLAAYYFGDVPSALFTLFQTCTLDTWTSMARPLMTKSSLVCPLLIAVIMVVTLVLLNLVTAVIVHNAFDRAKEDEELIAVQKRESMRAEIDELRSIFMDIDQDGSGSLSKAEYDDACQNNLRVRKKLNALEINPGETEEIWKLLDLGNGELRVEQFASGLRAMQGDARAKDSFTIVQRLRRVNVRIAELCQQLKEHQAVTDGLRTEAVEAQRLLGTVLQEMCEFVTYTGACLPSSPMPLPVSELERIRDAMRSKAEHYM